MPTKTVVDNTSVQNKATASGTNRSAITFAQNQITVSGQTSGTRCQLSNVADPVSASDATTKSYVDAKIAELSTGLSWKDPVVAKANFHLAGAYSSGALEATVAGDIPPSMV